MTRFEAWVVAGWLFTLGAGSVLMYQAYVPFVYEEAVLWGVAFAFLGVDAVIAVTQRATLGRIALASLFATLAILTRPTVGLGPTIGLAFLALCAAVSAARTRAGAKGKTGSATPTNTDGFRRVVLLGVGAVVPVLTLGAVNFAKFGEIGIPYSAYFLGRKSPVVHSVIEHNHGSFFNVRIIPTALLAYLRPDTFHLDAQWPYVGFNSKVPTTLFGAHVYGWTVSIPTMMPLLSVLAVAGGIALVRGGRRRGPVNVLIPALVGTTIAVIPGLAYCFFAPYYMGDFLPLLVILASVAVCGLAQMPEAGWTGARRTGIVLVIVLAAANIFLCTRRNRLAEMTWRQSTATSGRSRTMHLGPARVEQ